MAAASLEKNHSDGLSGCFEISQSILGQVLSHPDPVCRLSVLNVGGNANSNASNSLQYGLSYSNANNELSNSNTNIGSRVNFVLIINPSDNDLARVQNIRNHTIRTSSAQVKARMNKQRPFTMTKTIKNVYGDIISLDSLRQSADDACTPRKNKKEVAAFRADQDNLLAKLHDDLKEHTFEPSEYVTYHRMECGKSRLIADVPLYPDRIVQCAIANLLEDRLNSKLIYQTHASIKGHGTHTAMMDARKHLHNDPKLNWCFSCDIDQCFRSMPSSRVKAMNRRYISDGELLHLLDLIIDKYNETGNTGIALGGRLSPMFANLYLNDLNQHLKHDRHVHVMENYMDNFFIFGYSKEWLHDIRKDVVATLAEMDLRLNDNWAVRPVSSTQGVDMVGWVVFKDHVLIRKKTKQKMIRTFRDLEYKIDHGISWNEHDYGAYHSYMGSLKWFDSYNLYLKHIRPVQCKLQDLQRYQTGWRAYRSYIKNNGEEPSL